MFSLLNYVILFVVLIILGIFYRRFEDKRIRQEERDNYETIRKYLLNSDSLGDNKKPIIWIHVPYEYNSRNWISFYSRSSFDLNQPYLYLTVKSIIQHCKENFHICIIDDTSFEKLIPGWDIDLSVVANPISDNIRKIALTKLIYNYGGMIVPISFLCLRNLMPLYEKGIRNDKMFICENIDRNITSTTQNFYPDIRFMGANAENETVKELIDFMQRTTSTDYTDQSVFLGDFNRWCNTRIGRGKINLIDGIDIGTKDMNKQQILVEHLLGQDFIDLYPQAYGIYIPADEILNRRQYEWFARMSPTQIIQGNMIISKYIILANVAGSNGGVIEPLENRPNWVSFWKVPSGAPLWGIKPNFLGDNLIQMKYPDN